MSVIYDVEFSYYVVADKYLSMVKKYKKPSRFNWIEVSELCMHGIRDGLCGL